MALPPQSLLTATQLGHILAATRKAANLSQTALASRLGLSQSRVSHLESNACQLSVEQLLTWCSVLELELTVGPRGEPELPAGQTDW
jgi:HTH-type transcriptional regulator/antitoxin HipB